MCPAVLQNLVKILSVMAVVAEDGIVVMTASSQTGNLKLIFLRNQFSSLFL